MENNNEIISEENKTEEENIKEQNVGSEIIKKAGSWTIFWKLPKLPLQQLL